jgi:hypothetical protein
MAGYEMTALPMLSPEEEQNLLKKIEASVNPAFPRRAQILVDRGVCCIPLEPRSKITRLTDWQNAATTNPTQIHAWGLQYPDANTGAVAKAQLGHFWFLEIDRAGFKEEIELSCGAKIPSTFSVRSSPGRGHLYFAQNAESIAMGNKQGRDADGKETFSARVDRRYCVGPLSIHPSGGLYEILNDAQIVEAPSWLINWIMDQQPEHRTGHVTGHVVTLDDMSPVHEGGRNNFLARELGKKRQNLRWDKDQLLAYGLELNEKYCIPSLPEHEVRQTANSIARYEVKPTGVLLMGGPEKPAEIVVPKLNKVEYPVFPDWVMAGTSIYENFVAPVCAENCRIPYFMFLPCAALMMNYLGLKVRVEHKNWTPGFCMVLVGEKGRAIKSSSVNDSVAYMTAAGILGDGEITSNLNASTKSLVWTVGSTEGLGFGNEADRLSQRSPVLR